MAASSELWCCLKCFHMRIRANNTLKEKWIASNRKKKKTESGFACIWQLMKTKHGHTAVRWVSKEINRTKSDKEEKKSDSTKKWNWKKKCNRSVECGMKYNQKLNREKKASTECPGLPQVCFMCMCFYFSSFSLPWDA